MLVSSGSWEWVVIDLEGVTVTVTEALAVRCVIAAAKAERPRRGRETANRDIIINVMNNLFVLFYVLSLFFRS